MHPRKHCLALLGAFLAASPVLAQPPASPEVPTAEAPHIKVGLEVKAGYRDSEDKRFPVPFNFGSIGGPTSGVFLRTVDPGSSIEVPDATIYLDAEWGDALLGHVKVDMIDLYDRNPTSTDHKIDVDEAWLRLGRKSDPGRLPDHWGGYLQVGKLPKLERQNDRHLESYGLVSTAFNRFEDLGVEAGVDLGRHAYLRASYTRGNPLFMRDPNALAGDNGTPASIANPPHPPLHSGEPILYDAEVEDLGAAGNHEETGGGAGVRFSNEDGSRRVELLAYGYRRTLAERVELEGTIYGGDLDLLSGPFDPYPQLHGNDKKEVGGNLWLYFDSLSFFAQYVDQDVAGLVRKGYEGELAWRFELPLFASLAGQQLFPSIAPAFRYSKLDPEFTNPARGTPAPSFAWEWIKTDGGLRIGIVPGTDLTLEHAHNKFRTKAGWRTSDETLATLRWRM